MFRIGIAFAAGVAIVTTAGGQPPVLTPTKTYPLEPFRLGAQVQFSSDSKRVFVLTRREVVLTPIAAGFTAKKITIGGPRVAFLMTPKEHVVVALDMSKQLTLHDPSKSKTLVKSVPLPLPATSLTPSPDGSVFVLTCSAGEFTGEKREWGVQLWDTAELKLLRPLPPSTFPVAQVVFSPDGTSVAVYDFGRVARIINVATGMVSARIETKPGAKGDGPYGCVGFSRDGTKLFAPADDNKSIAVWDIATQTQVGKLPRQDSGPTAGLYGIVGVHPDGKTLAAARYDGSKETVDMIDIESGDRMSRFLPKAEVGVLQLTFSPNGRWLGVAAGRGAMHQLELYDLK